MEKENMVDVNKFSAKEMDINLYMKIAHCLSIYRYNHGWIDVNEQEQTEAADFFNNKKNRRNFYIGKNTQNWKYDFDEKNDVLQKFEDGTPKLKIKTVHRTSKIATTRILVPKEKVEFFSF